MCSISTWGVLCKSTMFTFPPCCLHHPDLPTAGITLLAILPQRCHQLKSVDRVGVIFLLSCAPQRHRGCSRCSHYIPSCGWMMEIRLKSGKVALSCVSKDESKLIVTSALPSVQPQRLPAVQRDRHRPTAFVVTKRLKTALKTHFTSCVGCLLSVRSTEVILHWLKCLFNVISFRQLSTGRLKLRYFG